MNISEIHFHYTIIVKVIELTEKDKLIFEVDYPVDWESNIFEKRFIVFNDFLNYENQEGPFEGNPAIYDVTEESYSSTHKKLTIYSNAGKRSLLFSSVEIKKELKEKR